MAKLTRKEKIALQKKEGPVISSKQIQKQEKKQQSVKLWLGLLVAVFAFLIYSNTLNHDYVLDDFGLIKENTQTKQGAKAIPQIFKSSYRFGMNMTDLQLYRPLTKAMFALEWDIAPDTPALGHWMNVIFYALSCLILFHVLSLYFKNLFVPFVAALLFAVHPLHTEVVANIKSRDEIMTFLLCFSAAGFFYSYVMKDSSKALLAGLACYFIALFSKESSITFIAVIPLMFYFFTPATKKQYWRVLGGMIGLTVVFLLIRRSVLGGVTPEIPLIDNSLMAIDSFIGRRINAIYILGQYLKLMIFPDTLIADASYNHFPEVSFTNWKFLLTLGILLAAAVYAIVNFKKKDPMSFAILYFFVTVSIVSNVVIMIGTNYGERLMYMPLLGFCLVVAILFQRIFKLSAVTSTIQSAGAFFNTYKIPVLISLFIAIAFGVRSMERNNDWKDNLSLYSSDVQKVPDSAHMLFYLGNHITTDDYLAELPDSNARELSRKKGLEYLTSAIKIYPGYADAYQRRGYIYFQRGLDTLAETDYIKALDYNPTHPIVYNNYGSLLFKKKLYAESMKSFENAVRYNPNYAHALNNLASVYGVYGQGETEMIEKDPANRDKHIMQARQYFETAVSYFLKAMKVDPEFTEPYRLIAVTYRNLGDIPSAERYERILKGMKPKLQ
jgi:protein O-mannosyl-transferase